MAHYSDNAVFLSHNYIKFSSYVAKIADLALRMSRDYAVSAWLMDGVTMDANGVTVNAGTELAQIVQFLDTLKTQETALGTSFRVYPALNIPTGTMDLGNSTKRASAITEARRLLSTSEGGTYIPSATRTFDGIFIDAEPCGNDATILANLGTFLDELRTSLNANGLSAKKIGLYAHKFGTGDSFACQPDWFFALAPKVDFIQVGVYNTSVASAAAYISLMEVNVKQILRCASGRYWSNDGSHVAPSNALTIYFGFPAFPTAGSHDATRENVPNASIGALRAISDLRLTDPGLLRFFAGSCIFLHLDGDGADGYAGFTTDWANWLSGWRNAVPPPMRPTLAGAIATIGSSATKLLDLHRKRAQIWVQAADANTEDVVLGSSGVSTSSGVKLKAGGIARIREGADAPLYAIRASANQDVRVLGEYVP